MTIAASKGRSCFPPLEPRENHALIWMSIRVMQYICNHISEVQTCFKITSFFVFFVFFGGGDKSSKLTQMKCFAANRDFKKHKQFFNMFQSRQQQFQHLLLLFDKIFYQYILIFTKRQIHLLSMSPYAYTHTHNWDSKAV